MVRAVGGTREDDRVDDQANAATVSTLPLTMRRSAPCWMAATVPARALSPYGRLPPSMIRTVVPPPEEDRMPEMSAPSCWKNPFP